MASFISSNNNNEKIKSLIIKETKILNNCIENWYKRYLEEDDKQDFTGCCNEDEINLLIKCYNIFSENNDLQSLDTNAVKALIAYYYMLVVFEYYMNRYIGIQYLKIVKEQQPEDPKDPKDSKDRYFQDNDDNVYAYFYEEGDDTENYIKVINAEEKIYYVSNKNRETYPYIYKDKQGKIKIKSQPDMYCLRYMLSTKESKDYYNLFVRSDKKWVSQIRQIILNMNPEPFEGGKQRIMKRTLKNRKKRTLKNRKKRTLKNRKKGTKRIIRNKKRRTLKI
jgi:hypothetical protein